MNKLYVFAVCLLLCVSSAFAGSNHYFVSDHSPSPELYNFLDNLSSFQLQLLSFLANPIPFFGNSFLLIQNEGGLNFNALYRQNVEDFAFAGGNVLYFGRESLASSDPSILGLLGVGSVIFPTIEGNSAFNNPISNDTQCDVITNGFRKNLRLIVPSQLYPYWVSNRLNNLQEVVSFDGSTVGCIQSSFFGGYLWTVRRFGAGHIVYMSTSTYIGEEFYKQGFYQAAFLNYFFYATSGGAAFGDPHIQTLERLEFDMPVESQGEVFNYFSTNSMSVNGRISHLAAIAPGLWLTEVGFTFTDSGITHQLHCKLDDQHNFQILLDGRQLNEPESGDNWSFTVDSREGLIGKWWDSDSGSIPFSFHAKNEYENSYVTIQAVSWNSAPSFAIRAYEPSEKLRARDVLNRGILQHTSATNMAREESEIPNVFQYQRMNLFEL